MRLIKRLTWLVAAAAVLVLAGQAQADPGPFPTPGNDDTLPSLGSFRIYVAPDFRGMLSGCTFYNSSTFKLQSPTMYDDATVVGHSNPHTHGSIPDTGGTAVGNAGTMIKDSDFTAVPAGFQGPAGEREVHTELRSMNLTFGPAAVRAGINAPLRPTSPGEVESKATTDIGNPAFDFPAQSFFDVFVEVDLPACSAFPGATLYNFQALIVAQDPLNSPPGFPPRVVYIHENSSAVPVYFKSSHPPLWNAGDFFGWLVLAGHGASFTNNEADVAEFETFMATVTEMPISAPGGIAEAPDVDASALEATTSGGSSGTTYAVIAGIAAGVVLLGAGGWYARRRWLS